MTNEQKVEAYRMRLDGATWQEVGDSLGVSKQAAWHALTPHYCTAGSRSCIFPGIGRWMYEEGMGYADIARRIGVPYSRVRDALIGYAEPRIKFINQMLELTGLSYEAAFLSNDEPV